MGAMPRPPEITVPAREGAPDNFSGLVLCDYVRVLASKGRSRNSSIGSPLEAQPAPSSDRPSSHKSANKDPMESNMQRNDNSKIKDPDKGKLA
jgi:hypothetical protein